MSVDKEVLRTIMVNNIEVVKNLEINKRDLNIEENFPTIFTGVRRCGKSFVFYQEMYTLIEKGYSWDQFLYINFEDERLIEFDVNDFNLLYESFIGIGDSNPIYFLDEVQNIDGWEKFARRLADEKKLVYITGSNAKMLSKEIESSLGGRYLSKEVYPYSFKEYLRANKYEINKVSLFYDIKESNNNIL